MTMFSLAEPDVLLAPDAAGLSERVRHLLDAARREFMASGFEAVSMDGIARVAGVSKETIYRYFPNKEALLRAAVAGLRADFSAQAADVAESGGDAEATLAGLARVIHDSAVEGGYLSAVWLTIAVSRAVPDLAAALRDDALSRLEPVRLYLERIAAERGFAQPVPIELAADFGSLAVEGPRHLMGWPPLDEAGRDRLSQRVVRLFLYGCSGDADMITPPSSGQLPPTQANPQTPSGRQEHIALLMSVARDQFLTRGFQGASLDEIGTMARVGRGTLYRHFGSKAGLFEAAMLEAARDVAGSPPALAAIGDPALVLERYLAAASAVLTSAASIALHRTVIAEARRAPELARQIYTQVRLPWTLPLADWISREAERGALVLDDPDWYAMQLLTMATCGNRPFSGNEAPDASARAAAVSRAVAIFLGGFTAALYPIE